MEDKIIKHLEFIQSNITRMNQCSFSIKGWTITIISALLAIYATSIVESPKGNVVFFLIGIVPTLLFWCLDSYYLQQERKFRQIYNDVAGITPQNKRIALKDFEIPLKKYVGFKYSYVKAMFSYTEAPLYITIIIGLLLGYILLR